MYLYIYIYIKTKTFGLNPLLHTFFLLDDFFSSLGVKTEIFAFRLVKKYKFIFLGLISPYAYTKGGIL